MLKEQTRSVERILVNTVLFIEHPCGVTAFEVVSQTGKSKPVVTNKEFVKTTDVHHKTPHGFSQAAKEVWTYVSKKDMAEFLDVMGNGSDEFFKLWNQFVDRHSPMTQIKKRGFGPSDLYRMDWESHLLYRFGEDTPVSRPYRIECIGGVGDDYFDLDAAEVILRKCPWVSNVERVDIPFYNLTDDHTQSVEFTVCLPQHKYNEIVRYWRDKRKHDFWACIVKEQIVYKDWNESNKYDDVLGLKPAWKGSAD